MPYLFQNPIINIGVYFDQPSMDHGPTIKAFDNGIAEYSASTIRDHFDTAQKTADMFGQLLDMQMCVQVKVPPNMAASKYSGYYEVWQDLKNYNDITDSPEEEQVLQRWRVVVEQRNVFYEEAETAEEARRIASEDRVWDEVYNSGTGDTYGVEITVEPDDD